MELQQQGIPGYGLYRSPYNNHGGNHDPGFPGNRGHLGGYPFPPMPGQNSYGYAHLGYPSSQSPGPREGMDIDNLFIKRRRLTRVQFSYRNQSYLSQSGAYLQLQQFCQLSIQVGRTRYDMHNTATAGGSEGG